MNPHTLFYYPYGSFTDRQAPLLKAAALYFDKLYILDPEKASGGEIGAVAVAQDVKLLQHKDVNILERVAPEDVLLKYEDALAAAVQTDLEDQGFHQLCENSGKARAWTLALAKVPKAIRDDQAMQRLMGELPRRLLPEVNKYTETYVETAENLHRKDFLRTKTQPGDNEIIVYRHADYPLPLGESIMINHALFGSLLYKEAAPVTDDPFHSQVLEHKLKRVRQMPGVREVIEDRATKGNLLAISTFTDRQLNLPMLSPKFHLEDILEYRQRHLSDLGQVREQLGWLARRMRSEPYSHEFEADLEHEVIPDIAKELEKVRKARDAWLKTKRARLALAGAGIVTGAAATIVGLILTPTPLLPVGLGLISTAGIPSLQLALDWKEGKTEAAENGLHYLLML